MKTGTIAAATAVLALLALPAHAAVVLEFEPEDGRAGGRVLGSSDESGVPVEQLTDLKVFLAPSALIADRARGPRDPGLTSFGILRVDDQGLGRFSGTVPDLPPGDYVAVAYCRSCTPGGSIFTVGGFRVLGSAVLPATGSSLLSVVSIAVTLLAAGTLLAFRPRRRERYSTSGRSIS